MSNPQRRNNIFSLPLETRLRIYRHALIRRERERPGSLNLVQYQIMVSTQAEPNNRKLVPTLFRTCKQICREALPILYSENRFMIDLAGSSLDWMRKIGPTNAARLKSLRLFPHAVYAATGQDWFGLPKDRNYSGPTWCELLQKLADEATGLEYVYVYLDAEESMGHYGAGRDLNFVRALGRLKVSGRLELRGFFAKEWPAYLQGKLGMSVWDEQSGYRNLLPSLREYQRGTGRLIP